MRGEDKTRLEKTREKMRQEEETGEKTRDMAKNFYTWIGRYLVFAN